MIYFACYHNMIWFIYMYIAPATISARSHKIVQSQYEITMPWVILHDRNNGKIMFFSSYSSYVGHARR